MSKLTFSDALQMINEERRVSRDDVLASALRRTVWIAEWHLPGCLSESSGACLTKRDAIESCLSMAEGADGAPRGMKRDLERNGYSNRTAPDAWARNAISSVYRTTLADLIG